MSDEIVTEEDQNALELEEGLIEQTDNSVREEDGPQPDDLQETPPEFVEDDD